MDISLTENKNKPAFPTLFEDEHGQQGAVGGLTKREYFAALALQGILAKTGISIYDVKIVSTMAIQNADELLKQLEESKEEYEK